MIASASSENGLGFSTTSSRRMPNGGPPASKIVVRLSKTTDVTPGTLRRAPMTVVSPTISGLETTTCVGAGDPPGNDLSRRSWPATASTLLRNWLPRVRPSS